MATATIVTIIATSAKVTTVPIETDSTMTVLATVTRGTRTVNTVYISIRRAKNDGQYSDGYNLKCQY